MRITLLLISCVAASDVHFDKAHGIIYEPMANVNIYTEVKKTYLNILIESPRNLLHAVLEGKHCGWHKQKLSMKKSFPLKTYEIQNHIDNRTCDNYLGVFDRMIKATLSENIVTHQKPRRRTARSPASIVLIPLAIGATGIFSYAAGQMAHDESQRKMEREERDRIASIHSALELNADNILSVANYMQSTDDAIATVAPLEAPAGTLSNLEHAFMSEHGLGEFVINFSEEMANKVIRQMLALTNNRLPTDINFMNAMRAACLSQQIDKTDDISEYCRQFALHTTRWDTSLKFSGVGLVNDPENAENIEAVLVSLSVDIPVYEFRSAGYQTHNLGFFTASNVRQMLQVPKFIVVYPNGAAREMKKSRCLYFNNGFACQNDLLEPNPCVEQSFLNMTTYACSPILVDPSKCGVWQTNTLMAVSLPKPSDIEYFHKEPNKRIEAIEIFNKTTNPAAVHCGRRTIKIRPSRRHSIYNTTIKYLSPDRITVDDDVQEFLRNLQRHSDEIHNKTSTIQNYATDTRHLMTEFKKHVYTNLATVEAKISTWIHGMIASVSSMTILVIIALITSFVIYRKISSNRQPSPVILGLTQTPQHNNRQSQDVQVRADNSSV